MSSNYRLYLLGLTAAITFIGYWALVSFTLTLRFCFGPSEIWLNNDWFNSPFHIYTSLVELLFLWALLELLLLIINKTILGVRTVYIIAILIFLAAFSFGHYRLDQTLQATRGELFFYDIWPDAGWVPVQRNELKNHCHSDAG